ncbi:MAG: NADPH-dependent glutamate synthase [Clostridia bacterium]|nr:NADPH-dependent glutamate synthase [Clostridia bacterium]
MAAKFNMSPLKNPMPTQDPMVRNGNFEEVALGYTAEMAIDEAKRCIGCKNKPCVQGCPVNIDIPGFIAKVAEGDFEGAYQVIAKDSSLPAVCGRVCPQESQCEGRCTRGIKAGCESVSIGRLERFVADYHNANCTEKPVPAPANGHKVAIIGSGPAGLTCAGDLAKMGYDVTVFEALHVAGGVLVYGIPEFRLPKAIVRQEVENLKALGVKIETNMVIGRVLTIEELKTEYGFEAVFIGSGAGLPKFMNIPGESLKGVYSANEFLTRSNLMKAYLIGSHTPIQHGKCVAVVGGGNVAMDAARTAKRLGAEVHIIYRRGEEELPARKEEIEHAKEEGIIFDLLTNPTKILATPTDNPRDPSYGWVNGIECVRMELGEPDASGRRSPKVIEGSEFTIPVDCVIMSLGTSPNPLIKATTEGLVTLRRGEIAVDEVGKTSLDGVYCGGDAATGAATVIKAMGAGKVAAKAIDEYIKTK